MKHSYIASLLITLVGVLSYGASAAADEAEEQKIRDKITSFRDAFNRHDAKAAAAVWMPDGKWYIGPRVVLNGRNNIQAYLERSFTENAAFKVVTAVDSIAFVTPNLALVDGSHEVKAGEMTVHENTKHTSVFTRNNEDWELVSLMEWVQPSAPVPAPASGNGRQWLFMLEAIVFGAIVIAYLWYKEMRKPATT